MVRTDTPGRQFAVAVLAVLVNGLVRRSDERLVSVREIAEAAQRAVLPQPAERIAGFEIAVCYEAAQADAFIGGDLYAVQDSARGVRLIVGDVRGKGMGAVAAVAVVIGAFREAAEQEATLEAVAQRLERALAREGTRRDGLDAFEGFTTAVLAELPHGGGTVRIVNRGHPPPCCSTPTAPSARCPPASRRCRSAWASWACGPTGRRRSPSPVGPRCTTRQTEPKPGTRRASSTIRRRGWPAASSGIRRPCSTPSPRTCAALRGRHGGRHGAARRTASTARRS
ncbi:hypothetical protein STENM36S_09348 [Streptomyces tendae]